MGGIRLFSKGSQELNKFKVSRKLLQRFQLGDVLHMFQLGNVISRKLVSQALLTLILSASARLISQGLRSVVRHLVFVYVYMNGPPSQAPQKIDNTSQQKRYHLTHGLWTSFIIAIMLEGFLNRYNASMDLIESIQHALWCKIYHIANRTDYCSHSLLQTCFNAYHLETFLEPESTLLQSGT